MIISGSHLLQQNVSNFEGRFESHTRGNPTCFQVLKLELSLLRRTLYIRANAVEFIKNNSDLIHFSYEIGKIFFLNQVLDFSVYGCLNKNKVSSMKTKKDKKKNNSWPSNF